MDQQSPLPRFRKPPVSEVAIGVQFQAPALTPVHFGSYYQMIKERFPTVAVQPPLQPAFETFEAAPMLQFPFPFPGMGVILPRMWFISPTGFSLIQLQSGRLNFNWRGGLDQSAYPHFDAVQSEFKTALDDLNALAQSENLPPISINQCELVYVNPLPTSATGVSLSEPQKIFRIWSSEKGEEWADPFEDISFNVRYRLSDETGIPFGRLAVGLSSGIAHDGSPAFHLEMVARGRPLGEGYAGVAAFHERAHEAIVRCFTAITTPEMHEHWERYQ